MVDAGLPVKPGLPKLLAAQPVRLPCVRYVNLFQAGARRWLRRSTPAWRKLLAPQPVRLRLFTQLSLDLSTLETA